MKQTYFVCVGLDSNTHKIISSVIEAETEESASISFRNQFGHEPTIHGPFFKKRNDNKLSNSEIIFSGKSIKANYQGWIVTGMILVSPKDYVFLFYDKPMSSLVKTKPTVEIVKIDELKVKK